MASCLCSALEFTLMVGLKKAIPEGKNRKAVTHHLPHVLWGGNGKGNMLSPSTSCHQGQAGE